MVVSVKGFVIALVLSVISFGAYAQAVKVVVIPLGGDAAPLQNVITVAKQNGDFDDPVAALASINDADEDNRYLVFIGPGVYTLDASLIMKSYVDISGSGRNATKLIGAIASHSTDSRSAIVTGASHAELRSLSIENNGQSSYAYGVYNNDTSVILSDMNITVTGSAHTNGVRNINDSSAMISDVNIQVSGGAIPGSTVINAGVYNWDDSFARISNSTISAEGIGAYSVLAGSGSGATETYISNTIVSAVIGRSVNHTPKCSFVFAVAGDPYDENCDP